MVQRDWRMCGKCKALFFDGDPGGRKGACPADGGDHMAGGFMFVLPHDVPGGPTEQTDWRFCSNCFVMFFDGSQDKGNCAHGGGHQAQGFNFVLPHIDPHAQPID